MLVLEAATVVIALVGALLANGIVQLTFVGLIAWMLYVIVREIRAPGPPDALAAARDEPPGPFLAGALVFVLIAGAFAIVGNQLDGLPRAVLFAVVVMVGGRAADHVRTRLLRLPRFRPTVDQA